MCASHACLCNKRYVQKKAEALKFKFMQAFEKI